MKEPRLISSPLSYAKSVERPGFIKPSRTKSLPKKLGLSFEKKLAKALERHAAHGSWFEYCDRNGRGWCQTDLILNFEGAAVVIECKLTLVPEAEMKLRHLYLPVVSAALQRVSCGLVVCKNITKDVPGPLALTLDEGLRLARSGEIPVLCWDGKSPLGFSPRVHWKAVGSPHETAPV